MASPRLRSMVLCIRFASLCLALGIGSFSAFAEKPDKELGRLVVVGDSLSAGFQNFSLFTSAAGGQTHGFAALIAQQTNARLTLPTISYPGIPPALILSGGQIVREAGLGTRVNPNQQTNNLSVPGFTVADSLIHPFPGDPTTNPIDALSDSVLGTPAGLFPLGCGPIPTALLNLLPLPPAVSSLIPPGTPSFVSEAACAISLRPQTIVVSIGANDVLQSLTLGLPPTDPLIFAKNYHLLMTLLAVTGADIVVSNVPDVTSVPFLVDSAVFQQVCGVPLPAGVDYVVPNLAAPSFNVCIYNAPVTQAQVAGLQSLTVAYNAIISSEVALLKAARVKAAIADVNGTLKTLSAQGYDVAGKHLTTAFLGGIFSLDAIHPTNTGYAILANTYISAMNNGLGTKIKPVDVGPIALQDPLVP